MGCPKIRGTFLGVLRIRTVVFWDLHWGPPTQGNCHIAAWKDPAATVDRLAEVLGWE